MAKRKILVVTGQSNATTVADATSWEDRHPNVRLRSPLAQPVQFTTDIVARERFTMPATFAGGPQAGRFGDLNRGNWQTVDTHGKVVNAVRFLTHYNPTASGLNLGTGTTLTFPGTGSIGLGSSGATLATTVRWQYNPNGLVITRERTGSTHTIDGSGWVGPTNSIVVSPPFFPAAEPGERFSYVATSGAVSTTTELKLVQLFGGLHDLGSLFDAPPQSLATGAHGAGLKAVLDSGGVPTTGRISCLSRPGYPGAPVSFTRRTDIGLVNSTNDPADTIEVNTQELKVGDAIFFEELIPASGANIAGIAMAGGPPAVSATVYVVSVTLGAPPFSNIQVSATKGGAVIPVGALVGLLLWKWAFPAVGLTENSTYYITRYATEIEEKSIASWLDATERLQITTHGLVEEERVRLKTGSGTLPAAFTFETDYYVHVIDKDNVQLSATRGGAAIAFAPGGTAGVILVRMEAYFHFYVSASVGGPEITVTVDVRSVLCIFLESFRGSLTGLQIRALTGANAGQAVPAGDIYFGDSPNFRAIIKLGAAFVTPPAIGDTYAIEVPPLNGQPIPFEKWAFFLPWCPFEGEAPFTTPVSAAITEALPVGSPVLATFSGPLPNDVVRFYPNGTFTPKINPGQRYYTVVANVAAAYLSATYDGLAIVSTAAIPPTGGALATLLRQEGKTNPFPPGFNYPNHYDAVGSYQPFRGPGVMPGPRQTFATGLAISLAEYYGEAIYVVHVAFGGTNIGHTDTPNGLGSWSATGDPNNIFSRFLEELDSAVLALQAQGDTGECIGIVWVQGEGDASFEDFANRYKVNERRLKTSMRQALKDRGLFSRPVEELKWISPHCQTTPWQFSTTVNAAKDALVAEDPYSATFDQFDLERMAQLTGVNGLKFGPGGDPLHYSGNGMTDLEQRAYAALLSLGESSVDIEVANMALALINEPAKVFSLDPLVDQSAQAAECGKFIKVARDEILESHSWAFATKLAALTATTLDANRSEWAFAYLLPTDMLNPLEVVLPGTTSASTTEVTPLWRSPLAQLVPIGAQTGNPFVIERDESDQLVLFCNVENALLRYNRRITPAIELPMKFKLAWARKLASLIAGQFVKEGGSALSQRLEALARIEKGDAAAVDASRQLNRPTPQQGPWDR